MRARGLPLLGCLTAVAVLATPLAAQSWRSLDVAQQLSDTAPTSVPGSATLCVMPPKQSLPHK